MAHDNRRTVGTLLGVALVSALAVGCVTPAESAGIGELELVVEPAVAPYDVVGRFRLTGLEAGTLDREIVFDGARSRGNVSLPAGRYSLTLQPGASVLCADGARDVLDTFEDGAAPSATLVSAPPRLVSIAPGQTLTARITLDLERPVAHVSSAGGAHVTCGPRGTTVLSRR